MKNLNLWLAVGLMSAAFPTMAGAANSPADEVMAVAKAQWAAENAKKPAAAMSSYADDYTEFNSDIDTRIEGKAMAARFTEAFDKDSSKPLLSDMINPKVQVYGDTAILTYNYVGMSQNKDGVVKTNTAKSTRVYVKQSGKWMLVHGHFTFDPTP